MIKQLKLKKIFIKSLCDVSSAVMSMAIFLAISYCLAFVFVIISRC